MFADLCSSAAARALFGGFFRRDLSSRYSGTLFGGLWALVQPVLLLGVYTFVFQKVFKVQIPELAGNSFVAFVACALWPWMAFQEAVQRGTQAVVANADLVRKVAFRTELLVLASVSSSFVLHATGFVVVSLVLVVGEGGYRLAGLPVVAAAWIVLFLLACGITLMTSALQVVLKDIDHLIGPAFMVLFYATPVLYPSTLLPETVRPWMELNPLLHLFEPMRAGLLAGEPGAVMMLLPAALPALGALFLGKWLHARLAAHFEDFL